MVFKDLYIQHIITGISQKKSFNTIPNSFVVYSERDKKNIDRWSNSKLKPTVKTIKNGLNYLFSKKGN